MTVRSPFCVSAKGNQSVSENCFYESNCVMCCVSRCSTLHKPGLSKLSGRQNSPQVIDEKRHNTQQRAFCHFRREYDYRQCMTSARIYYAVPKFATCQEDYLTFSSFYLKNQGCGRLAKPSTFYWKVNFCHFFHLCSTLCYM